MTERAHATSVAVAGPLAVALGPQLGRALTRFSRRRRHPRLEEQRLTAPLLALLGPGPRRLGAREWTAWPQDWRRLVAAVVVGCRAIPVPAAACSNTTIPRAQTLRETVFLPRLGPTLRPLEQAAVLRCDRGCRRPRWRRHGQEWHQALVGRLVSEVLVHRGGRGGRPWRHGPRARGQAVALGTVLRRQARAVPGRVGGVWAPGQRAPWWLATDLPAPLLDLVAWSERRMTGEEPCRETPGCRFGVRREGTPFRPPASLARFTRWVGVALFLWTAVGQAIAHTTPRVRLPCRRKGPR
jgi:hypothetical protein